MSKAEDILRSIAGNLGTGKPTVIPSIPAVPGTGDSDVDQFLSAIKQTVETWAGKRGDSLDSTVTWRELINKQFATIDLTGGVPTGGGTTTPPVKPATQNDLTPPPAPKNLVATGALSTIILDWDVPTYGNHAYTEIWRSGTNVLGTAERIGMCPGAVYADSVGGGHSYYYWIRFVSTADVVGPYNKTDGTLGETALDPTYLLEVLNGQISTSELNSSLNTRINLIDASASVSGSVAQRIAAEATARTAAINNEASARAQAILDEASARGTADSALQTQINTLSAASSGDFQELIAAIQEEQTARISADAAEATTRETLASQMRGAYTGTDVTQVTTGLIYNERTARSSADSALSTSISTLSSTVTGNYNTLNAAITTESSTRATADSALSTRIDTVTASSNSNAAAITAEATARSNADSALSTRIDTVTASANSNAAAITAEQTARANADTALGTRIDTVTASANSNAAAITAEQTARANADSALSTRIDTVTTASNNNTAAITAEATARSNGDTANATLIGQVQARLDTGDFAAVKTESSATASSVTGIQAKYSVKVDTNGYVSGFGLISSANNATPFSQFIFKADQFAFGAPGQTTVYPFTIQTTATTVNGVAVPAGVYIDAAYIKNGTITSAKIGNLAVDNAKIADATITSAKIDSIDAAKITTGTLDANRIGANAITAAKIDSRGLTIKDAAGTVLFGAGTALSTTYINGLGAFATLNTITSANVSTYIADAAIGSAKIISLDAGKISTGTLLADRIAALSITGAKIAAGTITADKITATSLSAISANLGEVTTGVARNSNWSSYLNLAATGGSRFLQCGGNVAINADGSGYFARTIVSAPNIIAQGSAGFWSGWIPWETNPWEAYIDTGVYVSGSWTTASTNQYLATATIAGGQSWGGGGMGWTEASIVVGDGLVTYGGVWEDNRIFIRVRFNWSNGPGAIGVGTITWKLCQV